MAHKESDVANLDMIARMIAAAGRRVGRYDPDQLVRLQGLHRCLDDAMVEAVAGIRASGVTWASIGEALGVTRQAVIQGYSQAVKDRGAA